MACDLQQFVNREALIDAFQGLLTHPRRRLLLVEGPAGIGKSCLLWQLRHLCRAGGGTPLFVDLADPRLVAPESLIGAFGAQLGTTFDDPEPTPAGLLGSLATTRGGVTISGSANVGGDVVGGDKITINNSSVVVRLGGGIEMALENHRARLELALRRTLIERLRDRPLVVLLDHLSKEPGQQATAEVTQWLRYSLIAWLLEEPEAFANLRLVVAGRQPPFGTDVEQWRYLAGSEVVRPLLPEAVRQFWVDRRRLDETHLPGFIEVSGGNPGLLFLMANNSEAARRKMA